MINWEYFKQRIDELDKNRRRIAIIQGEPVYCNDYDTCDGCYRRIELQSGLNICSDSKLVEWAMSEYEEELKPCPFCGEESIQCWTLYSEDGNKKYQVRCVKCGCRTKEFYNKEDAEKAWNRRDEK